MAEIQTDFKCHCGGAVMLNVEEIYKGNNGILGPGGRSYYGVKQTFNCSNCGCVYVPTEKNGLKILSESEVSKLLKN
ncbi:MAG: hypothetical protein ACR2IQ_00770 [Minisyncoccia bacterium]